MEASTSDERWCLRGGTAGERVRGMRGRGRYVASDCNWLDGLCHVRMDARRLDGWSNCTTNAWMVVCPTDQWSISAGGGSCTRASVHQEIMNRVTRPPRPSVRSEVYITYISISNGSIKSTARQDARAQREHELYGYTSESTAGQERTRDKRSK